MDKAKILLECDKLLWGSPRLKPRDFFSMMSQIVTPEEDIDFYGRGPWIEKFEVKMAKILGKESAVFMPSGTMAQQIALRVWSDHKKSSLIGFHPKSHLQVHEQEAIYQLHPNLKVKLVGDANKLITLEDIQQAQLAGGTLLLELPQRELGGELPTWEELQDQIHFCQENDITLHLDGARLWECGPYYQKPYAEIIKDFSSVYVSFYKGLGGVAGAILAGSENFVQECKIWQRRYGGNLISLYPYYLSADHAYETRIGKMQDYHKKAREVAAILNDLPGVTTRPTVPPTNMFHCFVEGSLQQAEDKIMLLAQEEKTRVIPSLIPLNDNTFSFEFSVGDSTLEYSKEQIQQYFKKLL
jgi:threonine aldolase